MSASIGSIFSPQQLVTNASAGTGQTPAATTTAGGSSTAAANPALYQDFGSGIFQTGPLGIRSPSSVSDTDMIVAEARFTFDQMQSRTRANRIETSFTGYRAAVSQSAQTAEAFNAADAALKTAQGAQDKAQAKVDDLTTQRDQLEQQKTALEGASPRPADYDAQMLAITNGLAQFTTDIANAQKEVDAAETAATDATTARDTALAALNKNSDILRTFAQVALAQRDTGGSHASDTAQDAAHDQHFDDVNDILARARRADIDQVDEDRSQAQADVDQRVEEQTALANSIAGGIAEIHAVLHDPGTEPNVDARNEALVSGGRFRIGG